MSDATTIFRFENVSFGYSTSGQNLVLVDNFSGDIKQGEFSIIIGRNGTGKSTVLKTMSRLIPALSGNIYLNNKLLNSYSSKEFPKIISFVTTDLPRNPVMTVIEMVSLGRFPYTKWTGTLNKTDRSEVEKALELTGLKSHENKPLYMISDGERQRAMIARTLAQNTPVIILDEPTAFLDLPNKYELVSLLAELTVSSGKTILLSTHDTGIAFRFPDKLLIMNEKTITSGAPEDMFLNGMIDRIFQSNQVELNMKTGEIEIIKEYNRFVSLICEDEIIKDWTIRALRRAGYDLSAGTNAECCIETSEINKKMVWKIGYDQSENYFYSLYDLIDFLKHLT